MTSFYVVEEPDDFFPDDFGNDDAPLPHPIFVQELVFDWWEDPDDFFADDFGNDSRIKPKAPTGLMLVLH